MSEDSVTPSLSVAIFHLGLKKSSENTIPVPAHPIPLLNTALNYYIAMCDNVDIDPHTLSQYLYQFFCRILIFLKFRAPEHSPESFTTSMAMLCQSSCTYC